MAKILHLRVTKNPEVHRLVSQWLFEVSSMKHLSVEEMASRLHTHNAFWYKKSTSNARQKFLDAFPECKREKINDTTVDYYMLEEKDDWEKQMRYLCKGKDRDTMPVVLSKKGITDDEIKQYHEAYWLENDRLKEKGAAIAAHTGDSPKRKVRQETFTEMLIRTIPHRETKWDYRDNFHKKQMYEHVMLSLGNKSKVLDVMIVRRLINACFNAADPKGFRECMYAQVFTSLDQYDDY